MPKPAKLAKSAHAGDTHDDYASSIVPSGSRRGLISMSAVMLGFTFFAASMWTGGKLGASLMSLAAGPLSIAPMNGIVCAALVYILASKLLYPSISLDAIAPEPD